MHELVGLGHSITHVVVGLCRDETRTSEHIGISPAEEGWTVANDSEMYLVAALTCYTLQHLWCTALNCFRSCESGHLLFQHCRLVQRHTAPYRDSRCQATSQTRVWNSINVSGSTVAEPWITKAKTI
jgi:hypothetical protein